MHRSHLALASCRRRRFQLRHGQLLVSLLQAATHRRQLHGGVLSPPPGLRRCRHVLRQRLVLLPRQHLHLLRGSVRSPALLRLAHLAFAQHPLHQHLQPPPRVMMHREPGDTQG
jgi:hypothetical protein